MEIGEVEKGWKLIEKNIYKDKNRYISKFECIECGYITTINISYLKRYRRICQECKRKKEEALIGSRFHRLVIISFSHSDKNHMKFYNCKCDCGNTTVTCLSKLKNEETKSCGCYSREILTGPKTHGMTNTKFYKCYCNMKRRCNDVNSNRYEQYGGRGIKVCEEWDDFMNFYNDMYELYVEHSKIHGEQNTTIDRIDVNKGYCKENCRWATWEEQAANKQNTIFIELYGYMWTIRQISEFFNIPYDIVGYFYRNGNLLSVLHNIQQSRYSYNDTIVLRDVIRRE